MARKNKRPTHKQGTSFTSLDKPPSEKLLQELSKSKLNGPYYYCDEMSSHAEGALYVILTLGLETNHDDVGLDNERKLTIVLTEGEAKYLRRSMQRTFKELDKQKEILKKFERLDRQERRAANKTQKVLE